MPPLVDTHVHINFQDFAGQQGELQRRWQSAGVVGLVHSCVTPGEFSEIQALVRELPELSCAVGLHPLEAQHWGREAWRTIEAGIAQGERVVAVGETGLDYYKAANCAEQETAFWEQLLLAQTHNLAVIIHCREAALPMRELLEKFWAKQGAVRGVMHCWGGTPEEMQWFLDLGFYISFSGIITFKNAHQLHECAPLVPAERLLVETDCPFLAPVPHRGQRNEPAYVLPVAAKVAALRGESLAQVAHQTTENAQSLFRLPVAVA
ncbi:hydrolase, TatD family [Gloeomargarita lithophora Alchichica-D10]|uniref:D-aminoacyl-tRNA deacylase n=1 Tax=Gloeomargarita lithophora Alchichica-D10 TaxID=1188229 RepID=A0A1J0AFE2_9CYAN|nr:TatD family hydrolase [Gloeomargarita lithophora]APB34631.1 hydrolase, TatD family [Gloeomargarita lithophora Alchichica-D10]